VMAIMGAAILPKMMGHPGDRYGMPRAFVVPFACFVFVSYYGYFRPKLSRCTLFVAEDSATETDRG